MLSEEFTEATFGEAASAAEARELLAEGGWDLVLLDIRIPGGSGFEILQEIASATPKTAVLMLSSYVEQEFAVRAFKFGADGYLTKDSLADEMLLAVKKLLAGGKYVSASMAESLASAIGAGGQSAHEALSPRELEVLRMVATGMTIKEIAGELSLSDKTVATYRTRISRKLSLSTNVELARYAIKHGLAD